MKEFSLINELDLDFVTKWPHVIVMGKRLTLEQTKEIVFVCQKDLVDLDRMNQHKEAFKHFDVISGLAELDHYDSMVKYTIEYEIKRVLGILDLTHFSLHWVDSSYIYGNNGWLHPNGKIAHNKNMGKHPSVSELTEDLIALTEKFPFLDLKMIAHDGEYSEYIKRKIFVATLKDKTLTIREPEFDLGLSQEEIDDFNELKDKVYSNPLSFNKPVCSLPKEWMEDYANRIKRVIPMVLESKEVKESIDREERNRLRREENKRKESVMWNQQ